MGLCLPFTDWLLHVFSDHPMPRQSGSMKPDIAMIPVKCCVNPGTLLWISCHSTQVLLCIITGTMPDAGHTGSHGSLSKKSAFLTWIPVIGYSLCCGNVAHNCCTLWQTEVLFLYMCFCVNLQRVPRCHCVASNIFCQDDTPGDKVVCPGD